VRSPYRRSEEDEEVKRMRVEATPPLIAIVDDEESVRVALDSLVRSAGYRSVAFESALAFLAGFQKQEIGCLILDINMPEMNGLEVQRRLIEMNCSIPIIFLSAHADSELRARALKRGAFAVLTKMLSGEALLSAIESALQSADR
jgi:FixJ family two-component response regulator